MECKCILGHGARDLLPSVVNAPQLAPLYKRTPFWTDQKKQTFKNNKIFLTCNEQILGES